MAKLNLARFLALGLTLALFVVGGQPQAGRVFSGSAHYVAHLVTYAIIAFAYARGFSKWPTLAAALLVAAIGIAHEIYEVQAHAHAFESADAAVNSLGALMGALAEKAIRRGKQQN